MSWTVVLPVPPSGNHANRIGRGFRRGGIAFPKIVKTPEAEAYMEGAALLVRAAPKHGWYWDGEQIVCEYHFYLTRDADCTNLIKVVEDSIFPALGIDDKWALPRAMTKEIVKVNPRVEVTIT